MDTQTSSATPAPAPAELPSFSEGAKPFVPVVGQGATLYGHSDAYAYTVMSVSASGKKAVLRRDRAVLLNGANSDAPDKLEFSPGGFVGHTSGVQRYRYEPMPDGMTVTVTLRKGWDGLPVWKAVGTPTRQSGRGACFGRRAEHYDFNF